jgi:methyl-accepting chemotaxis protein
MRLADSSIGLRLGLGFGLVLALMAALAAISLSQLYRVRDQLNHVVRENNAQVGAAKAMRETVYRAAIAARNAGLARDPGEMQRQAGQLEVEQQKYQAALAVLAGSRLGEEQQDMFDRIKAREAAARPALKKAVDIALTFNTELAVDVLNKEVRPAQEQWLDALDEFVTLIEIDNRRSAEAADAASGTAALWLVGLTVLAVLLGGMTSWAIARGITRPVRRAVAYAKAVAGGDLTAQVRIRSKDEMGQLLSALTEMTEGLAGIVSNVRQGSDSINGAARQIAAGSDDLSQRTEEQASSLEETASSMEQLTTTVRETAENARMADRMAQEASSTALQGGQVVDKVVATMGSIQESSRKIAEITAVIDGIAFQTNILALNAAVEAARAGEQGRGFAVVAAEVRGLAQRAAVAAKEIKELIGDSVQKVEGGGQLAGEAGRIMAEVVAAAGRVSEIIGRISHASAEQSSGIEQINKAITQMDQVTQQNSALVEQATASASAMLQEAEQLTGTVSAFKLRREEPGTEISAPAEAQSPARAGPDRAEALRPAGVVPQPA